MKSKFFVISCILFIVLTLSCFANGNVTDQNQEIKMQVWQGYYGNINTSGVNQFIFDGGDSNVLDQDINLQCTTERFYVTTLNSIDWDNLSVGTTQLVDDFINGVPIDLLSANKIFNLTHMFNVNGNVLTLNSTKTISLSEEYYIGILEYNNTPIFISEIKNGTSFANDSIEYQIMLPSPVYETTTYNLFLDPATCDYCGDGFCQDIEDCSICALDCGECESEKKEGEFDIRIINKCEDQNLNLSIIDVESNELLNNAMLKIYFDDSLKNVYNFDKNVNFFLDVGEYEFIISKDKYKTEKRVVEVINCSEIM